MGNNVNDMVQKCGFGHNHNKGNGVTVMKMLRKMYHQISAERDHKISLEA